MLYLICSAFIILLAIYCYFEWEKEFVRSTFLKVLVSLLIACFAWYCALDVKTWFAYLLAIGLTCAVPADFFLQYIRKNVTMYKFGIIFFSLMHIALIIAFCIFYGFSIWDIVILIILATILSLFQNIEKWNLGEVKIELTNYTILVVLMSAKAISIYITHPSLPTLLLGLAGLFFFTSDLFLGIWNYYKDRFRYLLLNRIIYFVGQLLFALCLFFMM